MIITSRIETDFLLRGSPEIVHAVQDDKYSRNLEISMYADGAAFAPEGDIRVRVGYIKPDGTGGVYDALPDGTAACSLSGNVVTVALAPQVLTVPGRVQLNVALISDTAKLHTFAIFVHVTENIALKAMSEDYYNITGALVSSGWTPNMYLGTDANGNVVTKNAPDGSGDIAGSGWTPNAIMGTDNAGNLCTIAADTTLSEAGAPADAKAVGDALGNIAALLDLVNGEVI